jgi:hypothetical protein
MPNRDPKAKPSSYYRPVPGSRELLTASWEDSAELLALERSRPDSEGLRPLCPVGGEWLGGARVEAEFAPVPLSVFDRLALLQTPLEQAVYLQLVRLAYGEGRNYCWVGKRELERRCRLSERRLHVALDGLVQKGQVKPLARRNRGTLYRVLLPAEALDGRPEPGVRLGARAEPGERRPRRGKERATRAALRARVQALAPALARLETTESVDHALLPAAGQTRVEGKGKSAAASADAKARPLPRPPAATKTRAPLGPVERVRPLESPLNEERFADLQKKGAGPAVSVAEIAAAFFKASGVRPSPEEQDAALSEITGLLEDGYQRAEILRAAEWYGRKFPKARKLDRLAYYIHQALAE